MTITASAGLVPSSSLAKWIDEGTYLEITFFTLNVLINTALTLMVAGWDLSPLLVQFAGICPTLMIARVGLGDTQMVNRSDPPVGATVAVPQKPRPVIDIVELEIDRDSDSW
ncbi:hypothetical protein PM082_018107 [Marasmius tenuissimus]|nr:hypothetical protein PM082_018107 [Marasmius tenuissimus]